MKRLLVALVVLAGTGEAGAGDEEAAKTSFREVVDRVDLEPSSLTGYRMRVYLSALNLNGQPLDLTEAKSIKVFVGASEKKLPYALGSYDATQSETALVILVQTSLDYSEALAMIGESIDRDLLAALGDRTQVALLPFGEATGTGKLAPIKNLRGKVSLSTDSSAGDPALLDTLDRALRVMRKAKPSVPGRPLRKIVLVIGDGRDMAGDKDRVTKAGTRAGKEGVRIHTIAYSPNDVRRPMLTLGELSKRSLGTFRWVRTAGQDSWKAALQQVRDEINKQYVITYFTRGEDDVAGKRMHIVTVGRTEATSNELKVPLPMCGTTECTNGICADDRCVSYTGGGGRGVLGWILIILAILVGGVVALGLVGYAMTKRQQRAQPAAPAQAPGQPAPPSAHVPARGAAHVAPGLLPNGRPIPALLILSGPRAGERHLLRNGYLIGKQPGCDLLIEDGYTSSQHAQIGMDATGVCRMYDRGSTNGTFVNGMRITDTFLQHGMTIRIGSTEIRFLAE